MNHKADIITIGTKLRYSIAGLGKSTFFNSLFVQKIGEFPQINYENLLASLPTVLSAIISKSLLVIVVVGIISLGIIRIVF